MSRLSLQVKNVTSLLLATGASISWGVFARRFFDLPPKPASLFALSGTLLLVAQTALLFIESKEEEELSWIRRERIERLKQFIDESDSLSRRITAETDAGNLEAVERWNLYRRDRHGK